MADDAVWGMRLDPDEAAVLQRYRRPRAERPDLDRAALVVIDVVPSFLGPDTAVVDAQQASRQACGEHGWRALPTIQTLIAAFRDRAAPVMFTVVSSRQGHLARPEPGSQSLAPGPPSAARQLPGDVVVPQLAPEADELVLAKTRSSAFFGTPLVTALVRLDVRTVVLAGCTTSGCVLASAIDASSNGFDVLVPHDAVFDRAPSLHAAALTTMDVKWAWVMDAATVLRGLGGTT